MKLHGFFLFITEAISKYDFFSVFFTLGKQIKCSQLDLVACKPDGLELRVQLAFCPWPSSK